MAQHEDAAHGEQQREEEVGRGAAQPRGRPDVDEPVVAARRLAPLEDEAPEELREGERQHGEVDAGEAQADPAHAERGEPRAQGGEQEGELHRRVGVGDEQRGHVGAAAVIGRVAERHEPAEAQEEMEARREEREDQDVGGEHEREGRGPERQGRQQGEARGHEEPGAGGCRPDRLLRLAHLPVLARDLRPPEEAVGPHHEHRDHHEEHQHERRLRQVGHAEHVEHGDDDRGEVGARQRSHAADHDHHEDRRQDVEVHQQVRAPARQLQRPAQSRERRAEREDPGEEPGLVDAERADHLAVLGRRAHEHADPRPRDQPPERERDHGRDRDEHDVVFRDRLAQDAPDAAQARRAGSEQVLRPPDHQHEVLDHQDHPEGGDELEELRGAIDRPQHQHLHRDAHEAHDRRRQQDGEPEGHRPVHDVRQRPAEIGAQHVEAAMGEVHDPRHAEDQRQPAGHEEQRARAGQPRQDLGDEEFHGRGRFLGSAGVILGREPRGSRERSSSGSSPADLMRREIPGAPARG